MPQNDRPDSPTHGLEHISHIIRQKYPASPKPRAKELPPSPVPNDAGLIVATTIVLIAAPAALYFLVSEKFLCSLAALVTALAAAFGPKVHADFIQPRRPPPTTASD
jgi:hypothetical protein